MRVRAWIVSYPRSGSTWLRLLLANILHPEEVRGYRDVEYMVPDYHSLARWKRELIQKYCSKHFIVKSHHPVLDAYFEEPVVYMYRDVRDVVLSDYYYEQWEQNTNCTFDEFFHRFVRGEVMFESWKMHVGIWARPVTAANLRHMVKYEDLYLDPAKELAQICEFLNIEARGDVLKQAVERCSFDKCVERSPREGVDSRKRGLSGKPGNWKNALTSEQKEAMWNDFGTTLEALGYVKHED